MEVLSLLVTLHATEPGGQSDMTVNIVSTQLENRRISRATSVFAIVNVRVQTNASNIPSIGVIVPVDGRSEGQLVF